MSRARPAARLFILAALSGCGGSEDAAGPPAPVPTPSTANGPRVEPGTPIAQAGPADLTIRYVERLPKLDYVVNSADPTVDGWPQPGSAVTWRAHLKNWSSRSLDGVSYAWSLDGARVGGGQLGIPPSGETSVEYTWTWERRRRELELVVDAENRFTVRGGPRHRLRVHTDALAIGLYVERGLYDHFRRFQHQLRIGNSSFEDWAQLQVELWNRILANAAFPETPSGVLDRVRLDAVTVVPDGALPLDPAAYASDSPFDDPAQARPNVADRSVDLQWGLTTATLDSYRNTSSLETNNQFYYSGYIQHEMGHARYLVDVYAWDVYHDTNGSRVEISERGERVAGSRYMPGTSVVFNGVPGLLLHQTPYQGLMTSDWRYVDRYSAAALNLIAGRRALDGNYYLPANNGAFLEDLPRENRVTLRDGSGRALANAQVQVFRAAPGDPGSVYTKVFDARPDLELRADSQGQVALGTNPFGASGRIVMVTDTTFANGTVILRVEHDGRVGYGFLESSDFNLEYWRGHRDLGGYELQLQLF
jgi:hypothetical protein